MAKARTGTGRTLKHPILKNVEYASITKNKKNVLEIEGKDITNITWREFQKYLGSKLGPGKYHFTIKFKNDAELYTGLTNGVDALSGVVKIDNSNEIIEQVTNAFKTLESKLNSATQLGGISYEMLMSSTKQGYDTQVSFLQQQLTFKDGTITELKIDIRDLNSELDKTDETIKLLEQKSGYNQYLEPISKLLMAKFGGGTPVKLQDSDPSGIPNEVLQVLGVIDYVKIQPEDLNKMVNLLSQYITATNLPLKGN